jgi:hypothetical protein
LQGFTEREELVSGTIIEPVWLYVLKNFRIRKGEINQPLEDQPPNSLFFNSMVLRRAPANNLRIGGIEDRLNACFLRNASTKIVDNSRFFDPQCQKPSPRAVISVTI